MVGKIWSLTFKKEHNYIKEKHQHKEYLYIRKFKYVNGLKLVPFEKEKTRTSSVSR